MTAVPRVVVAAPSAGHGRTAVSIGLLAALAAKGIRTSGFTIGPDRVDAAYLGLACGRPARNLDSRLVGPARIGPLFRYGAAGADIAVIEGSQGLFDVLSGHPDARSTAQIAAALRAPVLLVVDVAGMGQSVAALVRGFERYDPELRLGGVILNQVTSERHDRVLHDALDGTGVPVLGSLAGGRLSAAAALLPGRRHGVLPAVQGTLDAVRAVRRLGETVGAGVDLDRIVALAKSAPDLAVEAWSPGDAVRDATPGRASAGSRGGSAGSAAASGTGGSTARPAGEPGDQAPDAPPVIALAGGPAGGYGYPETAELLTAAGACVVPVDPFRDACLPPETVGLVLGGGLPEEYLDQLAENQDLAHWVRRLAASGHPIVAEGAGLAWLCQEYAGRPMCGLIEAAARNTEVLVTGYRVATAVADSPVTRAGQQAAGYKYHRVLVQPRSGHGRAPAGAAWTWADRPEGFAQRSLYASALWLHWAASPAMATRLVRAAAGSAAAAPAGTGSTRLLVLPRQRAAGPAAEQAVRVAAPGAVAAAVTCESGDGTVRVAAPGAVAAAVTGESGDGTVRVAAPGAVAAAVTCEPGDGTDVPVRQVPGGAAGPGPLDRVPG